MASNAAFVPLLLALALPQALAGGAVRAVAVANNQNEAVTEASKNPIRRVVSLLQMMAKKVEAEGKKEEELHDKYMCYCKTSGETLSQSIADNDAKIPQIQSDIEEGTAKLATEKAEVKQHQLDRDAAKVAEDKATAIRQKEHEAFLKESGETKATIDALSKAIPAIESGMAGGFLQTDAAALVRRVTLADVDLTDFDRDVVANFLQGGGTGKENYVPKSGQIVGILKQMKEDFDKDLASLEAQEAAAQKSYDELMAAKAKELGAHNAAIEKKLKLIGELSVDVVTWKNSLTDAEAAKIEDTKFLQDMEQNCATKEKEWDEICKTRSMELQAIAETIQILNSDDALELFKKTLPSPSLLQVRASVDQVRRKALAALKAVEHYRRPGTDFIELALSGKKVDFSKVIKMIDDMVALLAKEQQEDDHKKEYCANQLDFAEDKSKELQHSIDDLDTEITDKKETVATLTEELEALADSIKALDKSVLEADEMRKKENAEYTELMASNTAAKELIEFAKNRMNKFYNPKLYKPPPKRELTEEEKIYASMGGEVTAFLQVVDKSHKSDKSHKDAPPPPPEAVGGYKKKGEESGGVIAMMDLLVKDLDKEMQEAEVEEKDAQKDYEKMMDDAAQKRADDVKAITEKEGAKASAEEDLGTATDTKTETAGELMATKEYLAQLHTECDWLLQNFDLRKEGRAEEVDALKNAKATLSGADFSFMQKMAGIHKH